MPDFIDLSRRFHDLTGAEFDEPELLASLGEGGFLPADGWPEVLRHRRVILLAEAGPGKTREMQERASAPRASSPSSSRWRTSTGTGWPLRYRPGERALAAWLAGGNSRAWFSSTPSTS